MKSRDGDPERRRTWLEVDTGALAHNLGQFRSRSGAETRLGAVVKSNAYGHGSRLAASAFVDAGADWLCVNELDEALDLRGAGFETPILIMGWTPPARMDEVVDADVRPVVYDLPSLEALSAAASARGRRHPVHLKVETGTHRQGLNPQVWEPVLERLASDPSLHLEGAYTHFANIEDTTDHSFAERQLARFDEALHALKEAGLDPPLKHAAILFEKTEMDLLRIGIALYGVWPSRETLASAKESGTHEMDLRPALTWKTRLAQVQSVPEGEYIGYGCTHRTTRETRVAVIPVGYYEGYPRALSGIAHVLVRGRRAPVLGRVCMNLCMIDVTDVPEIGTGDEVVLLGVQGEDSIPVERVAGWAGTIPYEILARIHGGLPRIPK